MNLNQTSSSSSKPDAGPVEHELPILPPRNALIELTVFFLVAVGLQMGLEGFPDLNELQPHPFWLPVLLLSLQYGTVSGLLAAGVAILCIAVVGWPELDVNEDLFNYRLRIWTQPVLWILAALVLGQFRMRQISQLGESESRAEKLDIERGAMVEYSQNLERRCETLERRIAGRHDPAAHVVLDSFALMGRNESAALASGFAKCAEAAFAGAQCSVFAMRSGALTLAVSHGWDAEAPWRRTVRSHEPLFAAMTKEIRGVSVLRADDDAVLAGQGLAAIPVMSPAGDRVLGMLKIEFIAPEMFNEKTHAWLEVISAQLGPALELYGGDASGVAGEHATNAPATRKQGRHPARPAARAMPPEQHGEGSHPILKKPKVGR